MSIFRFTVWEEQSRIPKDIETWFEHFNRKGVPAAIMKVPGAKRDSFSVWRAGVEEGGDPEQIPVAYTVVRSCHGFYDYIK